MSEEYKEVILKTISETPSRTKENAGWGLWIIQKFKDGKSTDVVVVSGPYYPDKVSGKRKYPIGGMKVKDFDALKPYYPEFAGLAKNPPAYPTEAVVAEPETEAEVPF